jgi:hypothetical protein
MRKRIALIGLVAFATATLPLVVLAPAAVASREIRQHSPADVVRPYTINVTSLGGSALMGKHTLTNFSNFPNGQDKKAQFLHPRKLNDKKDKEVPPDFIGAVLVNGKKNTFDINVDIDNIPALILKRATGNMHTDKCRRFFLVTGLAEGEHTASVYYIPKNGAKGNTPDDTVTFLVKKPPPVPAKQKEDKRLYNMVLSYPPDQYTLTGDELYYFIANGTTDAPAMWCSIEGVQGTVHTDMTVSPPIWWAEFVGLGTIPGQGSGYTLSGMNADNDAIGPYTINIGQ